MVKKKNRGGDCYLAAGKIALGDYSDIKFQGVPYLVHAEVRGQGAIQGLRYGHAWVEDDEYVYDYSNNRRLKIPKVIYYLIGDIKTDNILKYRKYTFEQAREKILDTGNWGCWDIVVEYRDGGKIENWDDKGLVFYHEKDGNFVFPKNLIYLWLYDEKDVAKKLNGGEYDWVFYPITSSFMAWRSGYIPPLQQIWTKKYQKNHRGSEKLLGCVKAYYDEANNKMIIDMMSVHPKMKQKGIMGYMIGFLRKEFNLQQKDIIFDKPTKEGEIFENKKAYEIGGQLQNQ